MADYTHICVQGTIHCSQRGHRTREAADRCAARRNSALRSLGLLTDDNHWIVRPRIQPLKDLDYKDLFRDAVNMMAHIARAAGFDSADPTVEPPAIVARVEHLRAEVERLTAERVALLAPVDGINEDLGVLANMTCEDPKHNDLWCPTCEEYPTIRALAREAIRLRAELEEARLTLAAEQGRAEGAPSEGWESTITEWRKGRMRVRRQGWGWGWVLLEDPPSRRSIAAGVADTARAAMLSADASK